jgi:hypothetical protein
VTVTTRLRDAREVTVDWLDAPEDHTLLGWEAWSWERRQKADQPETGGPVEGVRAIKHARMRAWTRLEGVTLMETARPIAVGTAVMVRNRFNGEWGPDFEIAAGDGSSYLLKRRRDGTVLPLAFDASDVQLSR